MVLLLANSLSILITRDQGGVVFPGTTARLRISSRPGIDLINTQLLEDVTLKKSTNIIGILPISESSPLIAGKSIGTAVVVVQVRPFF